MTTSAFISNPNSVIPHYHSTRKSPLVSSSPRVPTRYAHCQRTKIVACSSRRSGEHQDSESVRDPVALGFADDFDRDYYDQLKEEYKDDPLITIYSSDDYELDNLGADWLSNDMRGRDLQKLRETAASRPAPDGLPFSPLHRTDMHSEDEVNNFNERVRTYDPTTGIPWQDVPNDMHRYPDCEFSDLRHDDEEYDTETILKELPFEPMKRPKISAAEEMDALRLALNELDYLDSLDDSFEYSSIDANVSRPSAEEMERWSRAAEERGGHATEHESYALPPFAPEEKPLPEPPLGEVPNQYSELVHAHGGSWRGEMEVMRLRWEKDTVSITERRMYQVESYIDLDEKGIRWETGLYVSLDEEENDESVEHSSTVRFAGKDCEEDLTPERAVFSGGSYVTQCSPVCTLKTQPLSLSSSAISFVAEGSKSVLEFGLMAKEGVEAERTRVILCGDDSIDSSISKRKRVHDPQAGYSWTHVVTIRERRVESGCTGTVDVEEPSEAMRIMMENGSWSGEGITLQPLFPSAGCMYVESMVRWTGRDKIEARDVEWNRIADLTKLEEENRESDGRGSHRSKRVRAAVRHDATRLASCNQLCEERIGDESTTTHAWKLTNHSCVATSPRPGKFVSDYFALELSKTLILTAPLRRALPSHQNTVTLIEQQGARHRRRLVVGRSADNHITGAALLDERKQSKE